MRTAIENEIEVSSTRNFSKYGKSWGDHKKMNMTKSTPFALARHQIFFLNKVNTILAFLGITLGVIISEFTWAYDCVLNPSIYTGCVLSTTYNVDTDMVEYTIGVLKWITFSLTSILLCTLIISNYKEFVWKKMQNEIFYNESYWNSKVWKPLVLELLVCVIQPIPGMNIHFNIQQLGMNIRYPLDCVLSMFMFFRFYIIMKYILFRIGLHNALSKWISRTTGVNIDWKFVAKHLISTYPLRMAFCILTFISLYISYCLRVCEFPVNAEFSHMWNSLWFSIMTICGIGYGDVQLQTHCGRTFSVTLGVISVTIVGIWVYIVSEILKFQPNEQRYIQLINKAKKTKKEETMAANMIQSCWRSHSGKHKITQRNSQKINFIAGQKTSQYLREWRDMRRKHSILNENELLVDEIRKQNEYISVKFNKIERILGFMAQQKK